MTITGSFYDDRDATASEVRLASLLTATAAVLDLDDEERQNFDLAALRQLPVLRKSDLPALQATMPPFGGLSRQQTARFPRLLLSPDPICQPQLDLPDGSHAARALYAAGFRAGQIVMNTFGYHLTPGGFLIDEAMRALGCSVIPAGSAATEQLLQVMARYDPEAYVGAAEHLIIIARAADAADVEFSIRRAAVSGAAVTPSLRASFRDRGVALYEMYGTAELGIVAFETSGHDGFVANEDLLVEILDLITRAPVAVGDIGEILVTRPDPRYPLIRFATGDLSAMLPGPSATGHSGARLRGRLGRADDTVKVKGMFVHPAQVMEITRAHPELGRARFVVTRAEERDQLTLEAEVTDPGGDMAERLAATLRAVTRLGGAVRLVAPGMVPDDGRRVVDERPVEN